MVNLLYLISYILYIIFTETCGLYVYRAELILEQNRRIGENPCLIEISKEEACDINTEEDFRLADAIYNYKMMKDKYE